MCLHNEIQLFYSLMCNETGFFCPHLKTCNEPHAIFWFEVNLLISSDQVTAE